MKTIKNIFKYVALLVLLVTLAACGANKYQITFMDESTIVSEMEVKSIDDLIRPQDLTKDGYVFKGWFKDLEGTIPFEFDSIIDSNLTIYAGWNKLLDVTFNTQGGSLITGVTLEKGQKVTEPINSPAKDGFEFVGWYKDENGSEVFDFGQTISNNTTIYAFYKNIFTVSFDSRGGTSLNDAKVTDGNLVAKPTTNPTREASAEGDVWSFLGWFSDEEATSFFDFNSPIKGNTTIYAGWTKNLVVNFEVDGGTEINPLDLEAGSVVERPITEPSKAGYAFAGWYADEERTVLFDFNQAVSSSLTIYAGWTELHKITFDTVGGSLISETEVKTGETVKIPLEQPVKEGYVFSGWYLDIKGRYPFDFDTLIDQNATIYAGWKQLITISFSTLGGSQVEEQVVIKGDFAIIPSEPEKSGFVFEGWYLDDRYFERYGFDKAVYEDLVLYANFVDSAKLDVLMADLSKIELPVSTSVDITFPTKGDSGSTLRFRSDSPKYISHTGKVSLAEQNSVGAFVNISVTATYSGAKATIFIPIIIEPLPEEEINSFEEIEFISLAEEYVVKPGVIDFYYTENGAIPYVDIGEFIYLLDGAIDSIADEPKKYVDGDETYWVIRYMEIVENTPSNITVKYIVEYSQNDEIVQRDVLEADFDFDANTLTTADFDFFSALGASTETDFGEGLTYGDYTVEEGSQVVIEFNKYRIDFVTFERDNETKFLIPQAIANLIFVGQVYYDTYFNGDKLFGLDSYQFLDSSDEGQNVIKQIKISSKNSKEIPDDLKRFNYDFIALSFDYFYGLKANAEETYYDFIGRNADDLMHGTRQEHYDAMFKLIYRFDDLHTYHQMSGYYISPSYENKLTFAMLGERTQAYYEGYWEISDLIEEKKLELRRVTPDGKTGIVTINSFNVDTPKNFKEDIDYLLANYPLIENIVIDITANGGGNVGAVWRTLGYMTDEPIMYHSSNILDGSSYSQEIIDLYPAYNLNFYIMISSVTFSAANLMAATAQEMGIATIIGLPSSGGASSIGAVITPTGDVFFKSSLNTMSMKLKDGTIASIEYGITPDILFFDSNDLYNDNYIQNVVNKNQPH